MERLDRVAPSRRLAQIAAVIGREFSYDLLSAASRIDEDDMQSALSLLEQADIIYRVGVSPFVRFAFKHVLLRDAIYDSLLRSKRQQIHADIAAILEHDFPELAENQPEVLALSLSRSEAITKWPFVAGSSPGNARSRIPPTSKRLPIFERPFSFSTLCRKRLSGSNKRSTFNWRWEYRLSPFEGMPPRKPAKRFRGLVPCACDSATSPNISKPCLGLGATAGCVERMMKRSAMADEFLSRSRALSDPVLLMVAHRVMGSTLLTVGDFQSSASHFEETIRLSTSKESSRYTTFTWWSPKRLHCCSYLGTCGS